MFEHPKSSVKIVRLELTSSKNPEEVLRFLVFKVLSGVGFREIRKPDKGKARQMISLTWKTTRLRLPPPNNTDMIHVIAIFALR